MSGEMIFIIYSFVLGFAVPLILILVFYVLVIRRLRTVGPKRKAHNGTKSGSTEANTNQQSSRTKERKKSHRKVTKLVLTVITVYFVSWAPYWITQVCWTILINMRFSIPCLSICILLGIASFYFLSQFKEIKLLISDGPYFHASGSFTFRDGFDCVFTCWMSILLKLRYFKDLYKKYL